MTRYYHESKGGPPVGPYTVHELHNLLRAGYLTAETRVAEKGKQAIPLGKLLGHLPKPTEVLATDELAYSICSTPMTQQIPADFERPRMDRLPIPSDVVDVDAGAASSCPFCKGCSIQKASAVYSAGTTSSTGSIGMVGFTDGGMAYGAAATSSFSLTNLARRAAPPEKQTSTKYLAGIVASAFVSWVSGGIAINVLFVQELGPQHFWYLVPFGFLILGIFTIWQCVVGIVRSRRFNRDLLPYLLFQWDRRWYCHRCDRFFQS